MQCVLDHLGWVATPSGSYACSAGRALRRLPSVEELALLDQIPVEDIPRILTLRTESKLVTNIKLRALIPYITPMHPLTLYTSGFEYLAARLELGL